MPSGHRNTYINGKNSKVLSPWALSRLIHKAKYLFLSLFFQSIGSSPNSVSHKAVVLLKFIIIECHPIRPKVKVIAYCFELSFDGVPPKIRVTFMEKVTISFPNFFSSFIRGSARFPYSSLRTRVEDTYSSRRLPSCLYVDLENYLNGHHCYF